jgi:excisionase family DNA binding protein
MEAFIREKANHAETQRSGFLNIQEIASYLGIKVSTIYSLVERKGIPHYRVGRLVRFKKPEIDQWMERQKEPAVDIKIEARRVVAHLKGRPSSDVNRIVKKAVEDNKKKVYTPPHGKPDQIEGLGKEVENGTL